MKIDFDIIDDIRKIINIPEITALVSAIRPFESLPTDFSNKSKFIVINMLAGTADQMQQGTVNVNIYVPDYADGYADVSNLRSITNAVYPLLDGAYTDFVSLEITNTPKTYKETDVPGYHYTNLRIRFYNPNVK